MKTPDNIPSDLLVAQKYAYEPSGFTLHALMREAESQDYGACIFELNGKRVLFRAAKITPTKTGQFVTLWKRGGSGPIIPYDKEDLIDLFVVCTRSAERLGQFVFHKDILVQKGVISNDGKGGKRAMRVYPPWDKTQSEQAHKTQAWQLSYFFEIKPNVAISTVQRLFQ